MGMIELCFVSKNFLLSMGTCQSRNDLLELIEIRNSINKQNECIQILMSSTKNELKEINDRICRMETKQLDTHDEHNISSKKLETKLNNLSTILNKTVASKSNVSSPPADTKENMSNQANAANPIQKFPK